jgi:hypothetical protein
MQHLADHGGLIDLLAGFKRVATLAAGRDTK